MGAGMTHADTIIQETLTTINGLEMIWVWTAERKDVENAKKRTISV
jgi:hypothetical protein